MSVVEYEVGCAVCRKPVELKDGVLVCSTHGVMYNGIPACASMLRQTGAKRRRQFEPWRRSKREKIPLPLRPVKFR